MPEDGKVDPAGSCGAESEASEPKGVAEEKGAAAAVAPKAVGVAMTDPARIEVATSGAAANGVEMRARFMRMRFFMPTIKTDGAGLRISGKVQG